MEAYSRFHTHQSEQSIPYLMAETGVPYVLRGGSNRHRWKRQACKYASSVAQVLITAVANSDGEQAYSEQNGLFDKNCTAKCGYNVEQNELHVSTSFAR